MTQPASPERGHAELKGDDPTLYVPAGTGTFFKRAAAFGLILLTIYLVLVTQTQSKQNGRALNAMEKTQDRILTELAEAEEDRDELLNLLKERDVEVDNIGDVDGDGDMDFALRAIPSGAPAPSSTSGPKTTPTQDPNAPRASSKPSPHPSPTRPPQSPEPSPPVSVDEPREEDHGILTEKPIVGCINHPLGRTCV